MTLDFCTDVSSTRLFTILTFDFIDMATRTLGIKYEIRGYKEAKASLNSLNLGIKKTQVAEQNLSAQKISNNQRINSSNAKSLKESQEQAKQLIKSEESRAKLVEKTNQRIFFSYLGLKKKIKDNFSGISNDFTKSLNQKISRIKIDYKDYIDFNYGSTAQRQRVIIKQEKQDFRKRQTYNGLSRSSRNRVIENRLIFREFGLDIKKIINQDLRKVLEETGKDNSGFFSGIKDLITSPISFSIDALLFPFQSAIAGAFQRIGEMQTEDLSRGFSENLQRAIGLEFQEVGGDFGTILGNAIFKSYEKGLKSAKDILNDRFKFDFFEFLADITQQVVKTVATQSPALGLKIHRRIQLNKYAKREAEIESGRRMIESDIPEATRKDIENNDSITLVYGGANTDPADIGKDYTARLLKPYMQGSAVIPISRTWTNSAIDSEFEADLKKVFQMILSNPLFKEGFSSFIGQQSFSGISEAQKEELLQEFEVENLTIENADQLFDLFSQLLSNKDFDSANFLI